MNNAIIEKVELVNGDMFSFTVKANGLNDWQLEEAVQSALGSVIGNCIIGTNGRAQVECFSNDNAAKVGDEITVAGDLIDNGGEAIVEDVELTYDGVTAEEAFREKNGN